MAPMTEEHAPNLIMGMTIGQVAYDAYCAKRNWKSVTGQRLPAWCDQSQDLRDAWNAAALAVKELFEVPLRAA